MSEKEKEKNEYQALQNTWYACVNRYLSTIDENERLQLVDDFRDALVDIKPDGQTALRKIYEHWEQNTWIPACKKELDTWVKANSFEAGDITNLHKQYEFIKRNNNYKRFRKIMQVIQDSGIGFGNADKNLVEGG